MAAQWHFRKRRPGDRARNSQVEKFFRSDEVGDRASAIIREGIQNSLDAAIVEQNASKSINIRVHFGECSASDIRDFVPGLFEHLESLGDSLPYAPARDSAVKFLAFEDFNTTGLQGDPEEWDPQDTNAFFNFFRGEGVTNKGGNQRGRHGVGKQVFSNASQAHAIFGLTVTEEGDARLMGTSTLTIHHLKGVPYDPDGWFGDVIFVQDDEFVVPVERSAVVARFASIFELERESCSGLSIVVPWINEDAVTFDGALKAVLKGFYWPILQKRLFVDLRANDEKLEIAGEKLLQFVDRIDPAERDELKATLDLATWAAGREPESIPSALPPEGNAQNWSDSLLPNPLKQQLLAELNDGQPIALHLPLTIRLKGKKTDDARLQTDFHVYLQRDPTCTGGNVQFIREGLIISGVRCRCPGIRALVIIEEGALAEFLGDAENPSHTEWQKETVREKYSFHDSYLKFVTRSVPNLLRTLQENQATADTTLLLDLFSLPVVEESGPKKRQPRKTAKTGGKTEPQTIHAPPPPRPRYSLRKRENGFVLSSGHPEADVPKAIEVQVAYGVRRGDPLKKYQKSDFDLHSRAITVNATGARIEHCEENRLRVAIEAREFEVAVTGFDVNRDLYLVPRLDSAKIDATEPEEADGEAV